MAIKKGVLSTDIFSYIMVLFLVVMLFVYFFERMPPFNEHTVFHSNINKLQSAINFACAFDEYETNLLVDVPDSYLELKGQEMCVEPDQSPRVCRIVFCSNPTNSTIRLSENSILNLKRNSTGFYLEKSTS